MKKQIFIFFLLGITFGNAQISDKNLKKHITYLASDKMKGRQTGSPEIEQAAQYIEGEFKKYGLTAKGEKGFRQTFDAKVRRIVVPDSIRKADNIIGFLDNGARKTIVIGAHYDHLGFGELGTRDTLNIGKIHNGADDNASGVAGLLELAKHYSKNKEKENFNFLFIAFGAEEWGLLGSKHFVENPTIALENIHWMLNMDMIGRYNPDNGLAIIGYGTSTAFEEIFKNLSSDLHYYTSREGKGGSDQTSFYNKRIPVLFFHTGGHDDYHKSTDDTERINFEALKSILELEIQILDNSMKISTMDFVETN